jgi:hypothetical protein
MQKWEYAHAMYNEKDGRLDPHWREGLAEIGGDCIPQFLEEAGKRGWELCCTLPYPAIKQSDGTLAVIFKRPVPIKARIVVERGRGERSRPMAQ